MDLRQYFRKLREIENSLTETYPLVVSLETADGGKAGIVTEVPRFSAAKMIAEGRAILASEEEKEVYRQQQMAAKHAADQAELAKRVQVTIISDAGLQNPPATKKSTPPSGGR